MMNFKFFNVAPKLPSELAFLEKLSGNIWWCWHPAAIELFTKISPNLWKEVEFNAKAFLSKIPQSRFDELAKDKEFLKLLKNVRSEFESDVPEFEITSQRRIAYFSMEYGIHESIRLYSGGLGILSGIIEEAKKSAKYSAEYDLAVNNALELIEGYETENYALLKAYANDLEALNAELFGTAVKKMREAANSLIEYERYK